jgi:hypothetical protein
LFFLFFLFFLARVLHPAPARDRADQLGNYSAGTSRQLATAVHDGSITGQPSPVRAGWSLCVDHVEGQQDGSPRRR